MLSVNAVDQEAVTESITNVNDGQEIKRALLPSELKKLQHSKRAAKAKKLTPCFSLSTPPADNASRIPLKRITDNIIRNATNTAGSSPIIPATPIVPSKTFDTLGKASSRPTVTMSLSSKLTLNARHTDLPKWKRFISKTHVEDDIDDYTRAVLSSLYYYRYPFSDVSSYETRAKISKIVLSTSTSAVNKRESSFEYEHFKRLSEGWRRSLLYLYDSLKVGAMDYYYYLHPELTICFSRSSTSIQAVIARAQPSLKKTLQSEGISFEDRSPQDLVDVVPLSKEDNPDHTEPDHTTDDENIDPKAIKEAINKRLNAARAKQATRRSVAVSSIVIRGDSNVHCLVDFLLNQKDGKASILLPELVSPVPFLGGTLCKCDASIIGPLKNGSSQIVINGLVLPSLHKALLDALYIEDDAHFDISIECDSRTEPLQAFPFV